MVQCAVCKRWGCRHDAPPKSLGRADLERHFEPMKLDERGVRDQCRGGRGQGRNIGTQFPITAFTRSYASSSLTVQAWYAETQRNRESGWPPSRRNLECPCAN